MSLPSSSSSTIFPNWNSDFWNQLQSFSSLGLLDQCSTNSNRSSTSNVTIPVGFFWDIENCPLPKGKKLCPSLIIHALRNHFVLNRPNHRKLEFLIAADVRKLSSEIAEAVSRSGGVTLAHVIGSTKNAADEKLREGMKKFVDIHGPLSPTLVLISSDIDFVHDLRAYQTRLGCRVVVLHGNSCSVQFRQGWNEIHDFRSFCENILAYRTPTPIPKKRKNKSSKKNRKTKSMYLSMASLSLGMSSGSPAQAPNKKNIIPIPTDTESRFFDTNIQTGEITYITGSKILVPPPTPCGYGSNSNFNLQSQSGIQIPIQTLKLEDVTLAAATATSSSKKRRRNRGKRKFANKGPLPLSLDLERNPQNSGDSLTTTTTKKKKKKNKRSYHGSGIMKKLKLKSLSTVEDSATETSILQPAKSDLIIDQLTQYCSGLSLKID